MTEFIVKVVIRILILSYICLTEYMNDQVMALVTTLVHVLAVAQVMEKLLLATSSYQIIQTFSPFYFGLNG